MPRRVFYSFHFAGDFWRTQQIRNINAISGQKLATPNTWEQVKRRGDAAVRNWIEDELNGKSCVVVLVGTHTASRRWVRYEIRRGWELGKGVVGIRVNRLLNQNGQGSVKGESPFERVLLPGRALTLARIAPLHTPLGLTSQQTYASIATNIEAWIEDAIAVRRNWEA